MKHIRRASNESVKNIIGVSIMVLLLTAGIYGWVEFAAWLLEGN